MRKRRGEAVASPPTPDSAQSFARARLIYMKYVKIPLSILFIGMIAGCASAPIKPTEIHGTTVINKSIGFREWSIVFPQGYEQFTPSTNGANSYSKGQVAWNMAKSIDKQAGWTAKEHIVFTSDYGAIAMSTVSIDNTLFDKTQIDELTRQLAQGFTFPSGQVIDRKVVTIQGRKVAKITRKLEPQSTYNPVYRVPIQPRYTVDFNGYCHFSDKAKLDKDIEDAISSLTAK